MGGGVPVSYTHLDVYKRQSMRCAGVVAKTHPGLSLALVQGPAPSSMGQNHLPLIRSFISAATVAGVWVVWVMWAVRAHYVPEKH